MDSLCRCSIACSRRMLLLTYYLQQWADGAVFGRFLLVVRFLSGPFGFLYLELVDCAFRVACISNATSMPGLCCSYGCFSGLHYVMLLCFELCDCLCMPLLFIYARFYDVSMGHYTWFDVTCNDLSDHTSTQCHACQRDSKRSNAYYA
jgi:hypothetical protein